jgi:uncharacterized protein YciI
MYFLLSYDLVDDYLVRRGALRERHLDLVRQGSARGEILLGGAFAGPVDAAALVFKAEDPSVVERFVRDDPYVKEGLIKAWRIREWSVVGGALAENPL